MEITLSSTESEYIGLSHSLRETIPIMNVFKELKRQGFPITDTQPQVKCEVFEDNSRALRIATNYKYCPGTKHISVKLYHFRDYVARGEIIISKVNTANQLADILTKPVNGDTLLLIRKKVLGW